MGCKKGKGVGYRCRVDAVWWGCRVYLFGQQGPPVYQVVLVCGGVVNPIVWGICRRPHHAREWVRVEGEG